MIKISRYLLVLAAVLVASITLPSSYWTIFEKVPRSPQVYYSCVKDNFIITEGSEKKSPDGTTYTTDEYESVLPLMYFRQLMADGKMPDTIKGVAMDAPSISRASSFFRYTPRKMKAPFPTLYPMLESQSGKVNLAMPDDYFRIEKRMEFIVARNNKIDEEKSELFTTALKNEGFVFPANIIAGIPTTRKSVDEGYFVTDAEGSLFHIKMVKGEPYVVRVPTPENFDIVYIEAVDIRSREFYCYIFTRDKGIYLLLDEVYDLQRLPVDGFNPEVHSFRMNADLFNKCITVFGENWYQAIAVDDMYNVVATYGEEWENLYDRPEGRAFATIFPFEIRLRDENSTFLGFFVNISPGFKWIFVNLAALAVFAYLIRRRKLSVRNSVADMIIVMVTGIYGLIATQLFPNKFNVRR